MYPLIFLLIALCYLAAAYLPFHQLMFVQKYQVLLDSSVIFTQLIYQSLILIALGIIILLMIAKFFKPSKDEQQRFSQIINISKYSMLVGIAASTLALAVAAGSSYGFWGLIGKPAPWSQEELERIALHEAGHAIIREIELPNSILRAEIVDTPAISKVYYWFSQSLPNGFVLGSTKSRLTTQEEIIKGIRIYLAGVAAEQVIHSAAQQYVSAEDDLEKVKQLVITLCNHGLSPAGPILWESLTEQEKAALYRDVVMPEYQLVMDTLDKHQADLLVITDQLVDKKQLTGEEIKKLMQQSK